MAFTAAAMAGVKSGRAKRKLLGADMLQSSNANDGFWNAVEQKAHMRDMWILLKKYDVDRSGSLDEQELANLIAHHAIESGTGATTSQSPNEAEIVWILETAGNYKHNLIHVQEIELVLQLWSSYVRNRDRIEYFFRKYGTSQSPKLDFNQMKMYLTELNGFPPKDSQLRAIMQAVNGDNGINRMQFILATSLWQSRAQGSTAADGCCIVS
mmetsp:Transcript_60388/g.126378  ORF Transcript_60388/g.126378 Transcript_60388/m.126378 type:complete len:211 (-) Transcript_60388:246-878(-)